METMTLLDCGHEPTPTRGTGTGSATAPDGRTMCYDCARVAAMDDAAATLPGKALPTFYLRGSDVVTWDGQTVGRVTHTGGPHHWSRERRYITVRLSNGVMGHGTGADGMWASLRRSR